MVEESWLQEAKRGNFKALPDPLRWRGGASRLVMLIDCYQIMSRSEMRKNLIVLKDEYRKSGVWRKNTLDLWLGLFFATRADRFILRLEPEDYENDPMEPELDSMSNALRSCLVRLDDTQRAQFLKRFK